MHTNNNQPILIFDGSCNLCNTVVDWALQSAPENTFTFVPFQSHEGQDLLVFLGFPPDRLDTLIFIHRDKILTHSSAFLTMVSFFPYWKYPAALCKYIPAAFRDALYKYASQNRIRWFGLRHDDCSIHIEK
ncbi:DUF393 domain-containing protein [Ascidiimonas aurantiaca]|uniref:thiol-disulfide oxidoreductase DCC family protein n=1 Tax=Ascidiimonas aurantiaca TaxID=1685432 RepID=UPI0030EBA805